MKGRKRAGRVPASGAGPSDPTWDVVGAEPDGMQYVSTGYRRTRLPTADEQANPPQDDE